MQPGVEVTALWRAMEHVDVVVGWRVGVCSRLDWFKFVVEQGVLV